MINEQNEKKQEKERQREEKARKKQRKEVLDDNRNESGMVVDAVTGAALPDHLIDVDHIHRRTDGGSNEKSNLRPVSKTLNRSQTLD